MVYQTQFKKVYQQIRTAGELDFKEAHIGLGER